MSMSAEDAIAIESLAADAGFAPEPDDGRFHVTLVNFDGPPDEAVERKEPDARECDGSLRLFWRTIARVTTAAATRQTRASAATLAPRDETQCGAENICRAV